MKNVFLTLGVALLFSAAVYAQPGKGNPGGNPVPIDGGISLLIAAGAALGGKKAFDAYKKKED